MNKIIKRGINAYKVFMKNKLATSLMMLFFGTMMFISALNGRGNDTRSLPLIIIFAGMIFSFWAFYRFGYIKSNYDFNKKENPEALKGAKKALVLQVLEALVYTLISAIGVYLLINEGLTNKVLDLITGGFMTLNGIFSAIFIYKNRENKDLHWKLEIILMILEFGIGPYFIFASNSISITGYIVMGVITMVAGLIETLSALTKESLKNTVQDGKNIINIMKDEDEKDVKD